MAGDFVKRTNQLLRDVGRTKLEIKVVVDQVYAQDQHETLYYAHPKGGGPKFLTRSLLQSVRPIMRGFARDALRPRGLVSAAIVGSEKIAKGVQKNAPHEFNDLRNSAAPSVKDGGRFVYKRAPIVKRMTRAQLNAKDRARGKGKRP